MPAVDLDDDMAKFARGMRKCVTGRLIAMEGEEERWSVRRH